MWSGNYGKNHKNNFARGFTPIGVLFLSVTVQWFLFLKIHTSIWIGQIGWTRSNCHSLLSIFISFSLLFNIRIWLNKHNDRVRLHILIRLNVLGFVIVSFSFYLSAYLSVLFASSLLFFFFLLRSNNNNHVQIVCSRYIRFLSLF